MARGSGGLLWVLAASAAAFAAADVLSGILRWSRDLFLLGYVVIVGPILSSYFLVNRVGLWREVRSRWVHGLVGAVVLSTLMVGGVVRQPASASPEGARLVFAILWLGVVYGAVDVALLTVMPVCAAREWWAGLGVRQRGPNRLVEGLVALGFSLFVTAVYHLGYAEFRGAAVVEPMIGNGLITLGYLATRHPITPVAAHVAMHVAAVLHGMESTVQLPPHS